MSRPLSEVRRRAEEALATVALRYPNGLGSYDTLSICTSALRSLLDATAQPDAVREAEAKLAAAEAEVRDLRGAMDADDERLRAASERVFGDFAFGCDTAMWLADEVMGLRQMLDVERAVREKAEARGAALEDALRNISEETTDATAQEIADRALAPKEEQK